MNNRNVLKDNRDEILRIAASHGAQDLSVYGSILRGKATDKSDIVILISLEPGRSLLDIVSIKQDLEYF